MVQRIENKMSFTFDKIVVKNNELKMLFTGSGIFSSKEFTKDELDRFYALYPSLKKQYNKAMHEYNRELGIRKRNKDLDK